MTTQKLDLEGVVPYGYYQMLGDPSEVEDVWGCAYPTVETVGYQLGDGFTVIVQRLLEYTSNTDQTFLNRTGRILL